MEVDQPVRIALFFSIHPACTVKQVTETDKHHWYRIHAVFAHLVRRILTSSQGEFYMLIWKTFQVNIPYVLSVPNIFRCPMVRKQQLLTKTNRFYIFSLISWLWSVYFIGGPAVSAVVLNCRHGPLARYAKLRVRMRRECRKRFPRHRR